MHQLKTPDLLVNAHNDPTIPLTCSPIDMAKEHSYLHLEMPREGGHVGFTLKQKDAFSWMEYRAWDFIQSN